MSFRVPGKIPTLPTDFEGRLFPINLPPRHHPVPGSIMDSTPQYWDRFFEANECSQAVATPMSKVLLSSNPPEVDQGEMAPEIWQLAGWQATKNLLGFFPRFQPRARVKVWNIDIFSEDICRCQSKDWKIS